VSFSKLGISTGLRHVSPDEVPLLDEEQVFENMASEIETLLSKVSLLPLSLRVYVKQTSISTKYNCCSYSL